MLPKDLKPIEIEENHVEPNEPNTKILNSKHMGQVFLDMRPMKQKAKQMEQLKDMHHERAILVLKIHLVDMGFISFQLDKH